jgi:hypothetical protein
MCERYQSDSSAAAKLASCVGDMAEALAKIASGAITDCGPNRLGTVNLDAQTMQAIARQLSDKEREAVEAEGYHGGLREGGIYAALHVEN